MTYTTKGRTECAFKTHGFWGMDQIEGFRETPETRYEYISDPNDPMKEIKNTNYIPHSEYLEAVEVTMKVETVD